MPRFEPQAVRKREGEERGVECRAALDLLDRMLQPDPENRINIAGILSHEWFGRSLHSVALNVNKGLLEMPDAMLTG